MAKKKNKKKGNFKKPVAKQEVMHTEEVETAVNEAEVETIAEPEKPAKLSKEERKEAKLKAKEEKAKAKEKEKNKKKKNGKEKFGAKVARSTKETISELKKVSWPKFGTVVKQTGIVIAVVLFFALVIFGIDQLLSLLTGLIYK